VALGRGGGGGGRRPAFAAARGGLELTDGAGLHCLGERFLLRQAVVNLLQNALDFSPAGGSVRLGAARVGGRVELSVEDEGPGVPNYALPRVFERFYSLPRPGSGARDRAPARWRGDAGEPAGRRSARRAPGAGGVRAEDRKTT